MLETSHFWAGASLLLLAGCVIAPDPARLPEPARVATPSGPSAEALASAAAEEAKALLAQAETDVQRARSQRARDQVGGRAGQGARQGPQGRRREGEEGRRCREAGGGGRRALPADQEQLPDLRGRRQDPEAQRAGRARVHDRRGDRGEAREQPPPDGRGVQEVLIGRRRAALGLALAALAFPSGALDLGEIEVLSSL